MSKLMNQKKKINFIKKRSNEELLESWEISPDQKELIQMASKNCESVKSHSLNVMSIYPNYTSIHNK